MTKPTTEQIDALLPQTQCGLCAYAGCKPYAEAIAQQGERIDLCLPGGIDVLDKLGALCGMDTKPMHAEMRNKQKPSLLAVIREHECIGCTKCIQACPVDAIIGAPKFMHTVITDVCNGCELCVPPCPVDCIDMIALPEKTDIEKQTLANQSRIRFEKHTARLTQDAQQRRKEHLQAKQTGLQIQSIDARKTAIMEIMIRKDSK